MITCTVTNCGARAHARGFCNLHYKRWQVTGDPLRSPTGTSADPRERFALKTRRTDSGCLEWTGTVGSSGYGQTTVNAVKKNAHRLAWELFVGEIPPGLQVLHKCDNPKCANIEHLFLGTQSDNIQDAWRKGRGRAPWQKVSA